MYNNITAHIFNLISASCSSADYSWPSQWSGGAGGNFLIKFNTAATNGWRVDVTFSASVDSFQVCK